MGADMLVAAVAIKKEDQPDFEAGKKLIEKLDLTHEDLLTSLVDEGQLDEEEYFLENGDPKVEEIRKWLLESLSEFEVAINSRYVASLQVRDLYLYLTGGLSWGDATDECIAMWRMGAVPGLLKAMGFVEDYWQEEKTVTPEEEQAALQSIATATQA